MLKKTYSQNLKTIRMFKTISNKGKKKKKNPVVSHMINNVALFKIVFTDC